MITAKLSNIPTLKKIASLSKVTSFAFLAFDILLGRVSFGLITDELSMLSFIW